ncbi:uncharacterized protein LOC143228134 [Tachypleus tridentatus]|uniref:uncharacterized protein LOC143228134 n=1 Tax=Tachypleus tridentatus TaxID=6853 RepID=UPI003FD15C24
MRDKTFMSSPIRHSTPAHLDHSIFTLPDHWTKSSSALTHHPNKVTTKLSDSLDQINISSQGSWNQQRTQVPESKYDMTTRQPVHKRHPESYTSIFSSTRFHNSVKNTHIPSENIVLTDNHKPLRSNLISPSWRTKVGVGLNKESTKGLLSIFNHQNPNKGSSFEQPKHSAMTTPTLINSEYLSTSNLDTPSLSLSQHQESVSEITPPKVKLQLEPLIALSNSASTSYTAAKRPSLTMSKFDVAKVSHKSELYSTTSDTTGNQNSDTKPVDNNDGNDHSVTSPNSIENVAFQANYSHELEDTLDGLLSNAVHFPVSDTLASISKQHESEDSRNLLNSPDSLVTSIIADPTSSTILFSQSTDSSSKTSSTDSSSETFQSDASHTTLSSAIESPTLISWIRFLLVGIVMMMVPPAFTEINAIVSSLATG